MKGGVYYLLGFLVFSYSSWAQVNLSGKTGLLYIPTATASKDGDLSFGYNYNPIGYTLRNNHTNPERVLFANISLLPRLNITVLLLQAIPTDKSKIKEGLGDRQIDISYLVLKEKPKFPSLAIVMSSPFTISAALLTHAIVATKHFNINSHLNWEATAGYGSPYFIYRHEDNLKNSNIFSQFTFEKKSEYVHNNGYLIGPFAGVKLAYQNQAGVMAEWDSQHLNVGAYATLWKSWTIQAGLLNGDQLMFGTSYHVQLLKPKKRIAKLDEKSN